MILRDLELHNYKQYQKLNLSFREGLVGIVGRNGSGKSTIFDAILYCLFGRDESRKELIKNSYCSSKSNVQLKLEFEIDEQVFQVMREFRGKALTTNAELYQNQRQIAKGNAAVNEEIAKLLNMERDAFKRSVFSGQKELGELSDTTGEARKKMVRKMLGLEKLDVMQSRINADNRTYKDRVLGQQQNLLNPEQLKALELKIAEIELELNDKSLERDSFANQLKSAEDAYKDVKIKHDVEEKKFNRSESLRNDIIREETRIEELQISSQRLQEELEELKRQKNKLCKQQPEIEAFEREKIEYAILKDVFDKILRRNYFENQIKTHRATLDQQDIELTELKQKIVDADRTKVGLVNLKVKKEQLEQENTVAWDEKSKIQDEISKVNGQKIDRQQSLVQIQRLGPNGQCPTCFQPLSNAYQSTINLLQDQINNYEAIVRNNFQLQSNTLDHKLSEIGKNIRDTDAMISNLEKAVARFDQIKQQIDNEAQRKLVTQSSIDSLKKSYDDFGGLQLDRNRFSMLEEKLKSFDYQYLEFKQNENYVNTEYPKTEIQIEQNAKNILNTQNTIAVKRIELSDIGFDQLYFEQIRSHKAELETRLLTAKDMFHNKEMEYREIDNLKKQEEKIIEDHNRVVQQIADKIEEINLNDQVSLLVGEFKTSILEKVSPTISRESSLLFSKITLGKFENIKVDENFDFFILDNGSYYPIARFSGGEIDLANLCLRIAITKAIADLSGANSTLNFLAFDEVFGSQDEERRFEIMNALTYLQEQFKQIYIISHVETVKEYFPNILEVSLVQQGSVVKWV